MNINRQPFMTGIKLIDEQHNDYLDLVEDILKLCLVSDITNNDIRQEMAKVIKYAAEHFEEEERLMQSLDYPFYEEHRAKHNLFREQLDAMLEELKQSTEVDYVNYQLRLGKWLVHWFGDQVRNDDMKMVRFIKEHPEAGLSKYNLN
jgi:hemerythrin